MLFDMNNLESYNIGLKQLHFLVWTGIRQAIPPNLKCLEFNENDLNSLEFQCGEKRFNPLACRSKHFYELIILRKARVSRGFIKGRVALA